jgi:hypothetical protein
MMQVVTTKGSEVKEDTNTETRRHNNSFHHKRAAFSPDIDELSSAHDNMTTSSSSLMPQNICTALLSQPHEKRLRIGDYDWYENSYSHSQSNISTVSSHWKPSIDSALMNDASTLNSFPPSSTETRCLSYQHQQEHQQIVSLPVDELPGRMNMDDDDACRSQSQTTTSIENDCADYDDTALLVDRLSDRLQSWSLVSHLKALRRNNVYDTNQSVQQAKRTVMRALLRDSTKSQSTQEI